MDISNLQKLDFNKFFWCWQISYYDGMLSCIAFYEDKPVYLSCEERERYFITNSKDEDGMAFYYPRIYKVYSLTNEDFIEFYRRNLYWKKYVGIHNEMSPEALKCPFKGQVKPESEWDKYPYWHDPYVFDKSSVLGYTIYDNDDHKLAISFDKIDKNDIEKIFTEEQWKDLNDKYYVSFNGGFLSLGSKEIYITKPIIEE